MGDNGVHSLMIPKQMPTKASNGSAQFDEKMHWKMPLKDKWIETEMKLKWRQIRFGAFNWYTVFTQLIKVNFFLCDSRCGSQMRKAIIDVYSGEINFVKMNPLTLLLFLLLNLNRGKTLIGSQALKRILIIPKNFGISYFSNVLKKQNGI